MQHCHSIRIFFKGIIAREYIAHIVKILIHGTLTKINTARPSILSGGFTKIDRRLIHTILGIKISSRDVSRCIVGMNQLVVACQSLDLLGLGDQGSTTFCGPLYTLQKRLNLISSTLKTCNNSKTYLPHKHLHFVAVMSAFEKIISDRSQIAVMWRNCLKKPVTSKEKSH